jgi:putative transposase
MEGIVGRQARVVVPGYPHHITQRGNRRQPTFFEPSDYRRYLHLLMEESKKADVDIWSYCLMPNHVHLVAVPSTEEGLRQAIGYTHRRYTRAINDRMEWRGYLWQGRFASFPMDETYLLATARYVELNPVRAQLVSSAGDFQWSSARHHLGLCEDPVIQRSPLRQMVDDWKGFLQQSEDETLGRKIKLACRNGQPLGTAEFVSDLEQRTGRVLRPQSPGPKTTE